MFYSNTNEKQDIRIGIEKTSMIEGVMISRVLQVSISKVSLQVFLCDTPKPGGHFCTIFFSLLKININQPHYYKGYKNMENLSKYLNYTKINKIQHFGSIYYKNLSFQPKNHRILNKALLAFFFTTGVMCKSHRPVYLQYLK